MSYYCQYILIFLDGFPQTYPIPLFHFIGAPPSLFFLILTTNNFQRAFHFTAKNQFHLHKRVLLSNDKFFTPKLLFPLSEQTIDHLTKRGFRTRALSLERKSLWICSNLNLPFFDKINRHTRDGAEN